MSSKLAYSVLVLAALFGATAVASAQTQPAAGASAKSDSKSDSMSNSSSNSMASMRHHKMKRHSRHHHMSSRGSMAKSRPGGAPVARKPAS